MQHTQLIIFQSWETPPVPPLAIYRNYFSAEKYWGKSVRSWNSNVRNRSQENKFITFIRVCAFSFVNSNIFNTMFEYYGVILQWRKSLLFLNCGIICPRKKIVQLLLAAVYVFRNVQSQNTDFRWRLVYQTWWFFLFFQTSNKFFFYLLNLFFTLIQDLYFLAITRFVVDLICYLKKQTNNKDSSD